MQVNRVSLDLNAASGLDRQDLYDVGTRESRSTRGAEVPYQRQTGLGSMRGPQTNRFQ